MTSISRVSLYALPIFPRHWVGVDHLDGSRVIIPCIAGGWHKRRPMASAIVFDPSESAPTFAGIGLDLPTDTTGLRVYKVARYCLRMSGAKEWVSEVVASSAPVALSILGYRGHGSRVRWNGSKIAAALGVDTLPIHDDNAYWQEDAAGRVGASAVPSDIFPVPTFCFDPPFRTAN